MKKLQREDIRQEVFDLYDDYAHNRLQRRDFIEKLSVYAVGGITRLLDMGIEPFLIASSVRAFIAQRLVRTLCQNCSQPADYDDEHLTGIGFPLENKHLIRTAGECRECRGTGYRGRMAIVEICSISDKIHEMITSGAPSSQLKPAAIADGMITLRDDGWAKVAAGLTTIEEVITSTAASG